MVELAFITDDAIVQKFREINARYPGSHAQTLLRESLSIVLGRVVPKPIRDQLRTQPDRQAWFEVVDRLMALRADTRLADERSDDPAPTPPVNPAIESPVRSAAIDSDAAPVPQDREPELAAETGLIL